MASNDFRVVRGIIEELESLVDFCREQYPVLNDAGMDPTLYYMNGNDGTYFDWHANHRLCEFMTFYPSDKGAIKILVNWDGEVTAYVYQDGAMMPFNEYDPWAVSFDKERVATLAAFLWENTDNNLGWDNPISVADLDASDYTEWVMPEESSFRR